MTRLIALLVLAAAPALAGERYALKASGSRLGFHGVASLHSFDAKVQEFTGEGEWNGGWNTSRGQLTIPVKKIDTGIGARNNKMFELIDAAKYPTMTFKVMGVEELPNRTEDGRVLEDLPAGVTKCAVKGELTLRGVTNPVRGVGKCSRLANGVAVEGTAPVDMTAYGITPPKVAFITMNPVVDVNYQLRFER